MLIEGNRGTSVTLNGETFTYFGGTNYLGMAQRAELMEAGNAAFSKYGFSFSASRLTSGEGQLLLELESELATFSNFEASVVLPAGYVSNLAVVNALDDLIDCWVIQPYAHSAIRTAISTSAKPVYTLADAVGAPPAGAKRAVFIEPVNPLTGELTDVPALLADIEDGSYLVMDECHSFGVLGTTGGGACEEFGLDRRNVIVTGTFSKAFGCYGGLVLASTEIIEAIKEKSGAYRGSTPLSPVVCAAALAALRVATVDRANTINALHKNVSLVNSLLQKAGLSKTSPVPIFYLLNPRELPALESALVENRFCVPVVGSYFKAACDLAFRWTIHATHQEQDIERLVSLVAHHIRL